MSQSEGTRCGESMKPWEQHAAVINMPRFDYAAASLLSRTSHSGFLITCPIKREKSATKEAINILRRYFELSTCATNDILGSVEKRPEQSNLDQVDADIVDKNMSTSDLREYGRDKKRRVSEDKEALLDSTTSASVLIQSDDAPCTAEVNNNCGVALQETTQTLKNVNDSVTVNKNSVVLSLVKLARNGILFFSISGGSLPNIVGVLESIFKDLNSGQIERPSWCHRILPVQATCLLKQEDLFNMMVKLIKDLFKDTKSHAEKALKFAVSYNRRGVEEHELGSNSSVLSRNECIQTIMDAVKKTLVNSCVDLRTPEIAVFIEVLPLVGPRTSCVAAVSILPCDLVNFKPRLSVKTLVYHAAENGRKKQ